MNLKCLSAVSHQGPFLEVNEDGYDYDINNSLFILLDGFGGSGVGDTGVSQLKNDIKDFFGKICEDMDSTLPFFYSPQYLLEANVLLNTIINAHKKLYKQNSQKEYHLRAGASGIIATRSESILTLVSIGNCKAFLLREGELKQLFVEDSFEFLSSNLSDKATKSIPLSGFGLYPDLNYQVRELRLNKGDKLLFLTDGAYANALNEEIISIFSNLDHSSKEQIASLFELNNERGNLDNQSCMLLEY